MTRDLIVELATDRDIDAILDLERRGWPQAGSMQADRDRFCRRIALGGMIVARLGAGGKLVGAISTFRPRWIHPATLDELLGGCPDDLLALPGEQRWTEIRARYRLPRDWHAATDDGRLGGGALHDADGEVVFGIGITTDPRERQRGIAQALLDGALAIAAGKGRGPFWRTADSRCTRSTHPTAPSNTCRARCNAMAWSSRSTSASVFTGPPAPSRCAAPMAARATS